MQDSVSEEEHFLIAKIYELVEWDAVAGGRIVAMPFLDTLEPRDNSLLNSLLELKRYRADLLPHLLRHGDLIGGIADENRVTAILASLEILFPEYGALFRSSAWIEDGVTDFEFGSILSLHRLAIGSQDLIRLLALKPWVQDGLTRVETYVIAHLTGVNPTQAANILGMPFLEHIHDADAAAVGSLTYLSGTAGNYYLQEVLLHPTLRGGITDELAHVVAVLHNMGEFRPDLVVALLDPEQVRVERRTVRLPLGGETILAVVRIGPGSQNTMELLEQAVRSHEEFMGEAYPKRYLGTLAADISPVGGVAYPKGTITIGRDNDYRLIAHESAHMYWGPFVAWIAEGAATFLEDVAVNRRDGVPLTPYYRGECPSADSIQAYEQFYERTGTPPDGNCPYSLGSGLFKDLYFSLGDDAFRQGFRRLYLATRDRSYRGECVGRTAGICYVGAAFVKNAPPEAAAIAGPIIHRWYYG
ncbi:MAG: M1 family metallopeptidase [Chloroflexi bacterium]|nr:M1 family metallopeptidase [Chloroflexota bacterium]